MFRLSYFMRQALFPSPVPARRWGRAPVVIWNLTRRCNLTCRHCYAVAADEHFPGELITAEAVAVLDDLRTAGVRALILSGGEPMLRADLSELARAAKQRGFFLALSTNGTLIDETNVADLAAVGYDYVGVSLDGIGANHDRFRGAPGAFEAALRGITLCQRHGIRVGLRFTLTRDNAADLPQLLDLMEAQNINKFYLSHLNYAGRGRRNRSDDADHRMTRRAMDLLFALCLRHLREGRASEFVTGNNDADGVYFLHWVGHNLPGSAAQLRDLLEEWGGNASGVGVANIDNRGDVHPDSYAWHHRLGNLRQRSFAEIWEAKDDPLMTALKRRPRPLKGRCGACAYQSICNGNTRVRAYRQTGDFWAEDPACYLSDAELGIDDIATSPSARESCHAHS